MDGNNSMTPADIAALTNNGMGDGNSWVWFLLIVLVLGWGGAGGRGPAPSNGVTQAELTNGLNNQTLQAQLASTTQAINAQTDTMMNQNNTNIVNAIQGFNNISQQVSNQTNVLQAQIQQLGAQMNECCCGIKTQMLNDRLEDRNRELAVAQSALNNAQQTQTILGNLGRFVAWAGNGTQTTGVVTS